LCQQRKATQQCSVPSQTRGFRGLIAATDAARGVFPHNKYIPLGVLRQHPPLHDAALLRCQPCWFQHGQWPFVLSAVPRPGRCRIEQQVCGTTVVGRPLRCRCCSAVCGCLKGCLKLVCLAFVSRRCWLGTSFRDSSSSHAQSVPCVSLMLRGSSLVYRVSQPDHSQGRQQQQAVSVRLSARSALCHAVVCISQSEGCFTFARVLRAQPRQAAPLPRHQLSDVE
jgi:hypothetical protein